MKKIFLLMVLASAAVIAVVATAGSDAANPAEETAQPHGGMRTKPGAALPSGHPEAMPADIQLSNSGKVLEVLDSGMCT